MFDRKSAQRTLNHCGRSRPAIGFRRAVARIRRGLFVIGIVSGAAAGADQHGEKEPESQRASVVIDCAGSPEEAVLSIGNQQIENWAQLTCTRYGHLIVPKTGYIWSFYGGYAPVVIAAQKISGTGQADIVGNDVYFTSIISKQLAPSLARDIAERARFDRSVALEDAPPVYLLEATSSSGMVQTLYFVDKAQGVEGAMPYPEGFDKPSEDALLPFYIFDAKKNKQNNSTTQ